MLRLSELFNNYDQIGFWSSISLVFFFVIFIIIIYNVIKYDKKLVRKWENMPFENDSENSDTNSVKP